MLHGGLRRSGTLLTLLFRYVRDDDGDTLIGLFSNGFTSRCSGQLGLGHNYTAKEQTPQKVPSLSKENVTQMACGQDHTAVITSKSVTRGAICVTLLPK